MLQMLIRRARRPRFLSAAISLSDRLKGDLANGGGRCARRAARTPKRRSVGGASMTCTIERRLNMMASDLTLDAAGRRLMGQIASANERLRPMHSVPAAIGSGCGRRPPPSNSHA